jgi:carboxylesterase
MPVMPGAEPYHHAGGQIGVLLCHGFTGSPQSLRPWAEYLTEAGMTVALPRLPGHGTTWQEMNATVWTDWYTEASRALDSLLAQCDQVFVAGLSMGGCLALRLAEERPDDVAGLVLVNPAVLNTNKQLLALPVIKRLTASIKGITNDIKKPGTQEYGYDRVPLRALDSMRGLWKATREDLPKVTAPLIVFRSIEDHVVEALSTQVITQRVSSRDVTERILDNSYHVATLDNDALAIFDGSVEFIRKHAPAAP